MAEFEITRQSVCMADDADAPHLLCVQLNVPDCPAELLDQLWRAADLPPMASWTCRINDQIVGYLWFAQNYDAKSLQIRLTGQVQIMTYNRVHFDYDSSGKRWLDVKATQA